VEIKSLLCILIFDLNHARNPNLHVQPSFYTFVASTRQNMQMNIKHIDLIWEQLSSGPDYGSELVGCSVSIEVHFYE
jgi:hypothetical protein